MTAARVLPFAALALVLSGSAQETAEDSSGERESAHLPKYPHPDQVASAMRRAASFYRAHVAFAGGYGWKSTRDLTMQHGEGEKQQTPTLTMIQPPGTPSVGLTMLRAYEVTGDRLFLQGAREAAESLMWCQLASGGWDSSFDYDRRRASRLHFRRDIDGGDTDARGRRAISSLDDDKTQSALLFLLELAQLDELQHDRDLAHAVRFGFDGLLAAQAPNGGWAQRFRGPSDPTKEPSPELKASYPETWARAFPGTDYTPFYTLNDNNVLNVMRLLLRAHEIDPADSRYLDAARRTGEFLILAQMPEPQPVWAQQYDFAMHPAWARKFEPPSVCSLESIGAMEALLELWLVTGEDRYLEPLPSALDWFERSRLQNRPESTSHTWARFYELETDRPLYCRAETYEVTYDDSDLPTHYGFIVGGSKLSNRLAALRNAFEKRGDHAALVAERAKDEAPPEGEKDWASRASKGASKARNALETQEKTGAWLDEGGLIDAKRFVSHMNAMGTYVEAGRRGGDVFRGWQEASATKARAEAEAKKAPEGERED